MKTKRPPYTVMRHGQWYWQPRGRMKTLVAPEALGADQERAFLRAWYLYHTAGQEPLLPKTERQKRKRIEKFESLYSPEPNSGCWLWHGSGDELGYGRFWDGKRDVQAHRWAYEHFVGPIPDGLVIDHLCRVPACVNPDHLEPVTQRVNLLRGLAPTAINARKTYCSRGHALVGKNLIRRKGGQRGCRTCKNAVRRLTRKSRAKPREAQQ